jgi:hypothetical protein
MNTKQFNQRFKGILSDYEHTKGCERGDDYIIIETVFGKLRVKPSPSPRIKLYSIFMVFTEKEKFDQQKFEDTVATGDFNKHSLKWNILNTDPEYVLNEFEERLDNLKYIKENGI